MKELPQSFGPRTGLHGVLTLPGEAQAGAAPVGFLLFNAGVIPRCGPHRLNVKLARTLAAAGHPVLRFDLSGHGDSPPADATLDPQTQGRRDLAAAMDHLQATLGVQRFALVGICSGAMNAYDAGLADARVAGVLMFDGYWYRSRWTRWVRDAKRLRVLLRERGWRGAAERALRQVEQGGGKAVTGVFSGSNNPPRAEFSRAVGELSARAALYFVYSGSIIDCYSYAAQFRHVFGNEPWFRRVRCEFMADVDHSFLELRAQRRFIDAVIDWLPAVQRAAQVS